MSSLNFEDRVSRRIRGRNTLMAGCGTSVTVLMLAGFAYLTWANSLPAAEVDHRVLPNPNGYDACAAAVTRLPPGPSTGTPWESDLTELRRDVSRARPVLIDLRAALRLPYLTPARDPNSVPQVAQYRQAARYLAAATRAELTSVRPGPAIEWALDGVELGAKVGRGGGLIDSLTGSACAAIGQNGAERCVAGLTAEEAHTAGKRLDVILGEFPAPAEVMEEERRASLLWTRQVLAGRSPITSSPAALGNPSTWLDHVKERTLLLVYPKSWGYSQVDRYWRSMAAELRKPYSKRVPPPPSPPEWDPVLGDAGMSLATLQFPFARTQAQLRLLRTELALREFRARHRAVPATLQELVPAQLSAVPVDPFSEQPLRYRRQGAGFLLYSVGPDLKDNGGQPISSPGVDASSIGDLVAGKLFPRRARARGPATR